MEEKVRRPISVWIAQILLIILAVLFLLPLLLNSSVVSNAEPRHIGAFATMLIIGLTVSSLSILSFCGMMKRKNYGRWIGVVILSLVPVASIISQIIANGSLYPDYENSEQLILGITGTVFFYGLFLWLILHLALSKSARAFFAPQPEIVP